MKVMSISTSKYAVLFDIDGTLLLTGGAGQHAFYATFREEFGVADPVDGVAFAGRSDRAIAMDLMSLNGMNPSEDNWQRFRSAYEDRLPHALEVNDGRLLPGVGALLAEIQKLQHVALGILTGNLEAGAQAKLSYYGLAGRFAFGGFGDNHTHRNDIASAALEAARTHVRNSQVGTASSITGSMVIGDTIHDIACAHSIGAYAVGVATGSASCEELAAVGADLVMEDLSDPERILAEIHSAQAA